MKCEGSSGSRMKCEGSSYFSTLDLNLGGSRMKCEGSSYERNLTVTRKPQVRGSK